MPRLPVFSFACFAGELTNAMRMVSFKSSNGLLVGAFALPEPAKWATEADVGGGGRIGGIVLFCLLPAPLLDFKSPVCGCTTGSDRNGFGSVASGTAFVFVFMFGKRSWKMCPIWQTKRFEPNDRVRGNGVVGRRDVDKNDVTFFMRQFFEVCVCVCKRKYK